MRSLVVETTGESLSSPAEGRFTRVEAADYLRISLVSLDRALAKRRISCFRIGRRVVFARHHLDEFLANNEAVAKVRSRREMYV